MNTIKSLGFVGLAAACLFAAQAFATTCPTAPATGGTQTQGGPICIAPVGQDGAGTGLQDELNDRTKSGTPQINVYDGQSQPSAHWELSPTTGSTSTMIFEIAGNANINSFGIYDPTANDPTAAGSYLQLFNGAASAGSKTTLYNNGGGSFTAAPLGGTDTTVMFGDGDVFGYYLETKDNQFFYSDPSLNQDSGDTYYPDGTPHMVAYRGNGQTQLEVTPGSNLYGKFLTDEYLLAWEDLPWSSSDLDYNDMVVQVESVTAVPEPAELGMFGLGVLLIGGFVALRRRRSMNV